MASCRFGKESEEFSMFADYWNICQKFWVPECSDEYWEDLIAELNEFEKKYCKISLARKLANALLSDLEQKNN